MLLINLKFYKVVHGLQGFLWLEHLTLHSINRLQFILGNLSCSFHIGVYIFLNCDGHSSVLLRSSFRKEFAIQLQGEQLTDSF